MAFLLTDAFPALSQTVDLEFNPGADYRVRCLAVQPDGKILVGGNFYTLGGQPWRALGRLHPDGSVDDTFNPAPDNIVTSIAVQADGRIVIGGFFATLGGQPRAYLGRLNSDGSVDPTFNPGADHYIEGLAIQPDGKILAVGAFRTLGGQTHEHIGRLNPDGSVDAQFNPRAQDFVGSMALQSDGKIVVSGPFINLNSRLRRDLGRFNPDGSLDTAYGPISGLIAVSTIALDADDNILFSGLFSAPVSGIHERVGRISPGGVVDPNFLPGDNGVAYSMVVQSDGRIVAGGTFDMLGGESVLKIGRIHPDGSLDREFNPGVTGVLYNTDVYCLAMQSDGKILVGGEFFGVGGQARHNLARLNNPGEAVQRLAVDCDRTTIAWTRSGVVPEVGHVTFELSMDGSNYSVLGHGTRIPGGWQLAGLALPRGQSFLLRARGRTKSGFNNGSSGLIETVQRVDPPGPMILCPEDLEVPLTSVDGASVHFAVQAADACGRPLTVVSEPPSGATFPVGTTDVACTTSDDAGNRAECRFRVVVLGARAVTRGIVEDLEILWRQASRPPDRNKLRHSIEELTRALDPALWVDETRPNPRHGQRVLHATEAAIHKLEQLLKDKNRSVSGDEVETILEMLAQMAGLLMESHAGSRD